MDARAVPRSHSLRETCAYRFGGGRRSQERKEDRKQVAIRLNFERSSLAVKLAIPSNAGLQYD